MNDEEKIRIGAIVLLLLAIAFVLGRWSDGSKEPPPPAPVAKVEPTIVPEATATPDRTHTEYMVEHSWRYGSEWVELLENEIRPLKKKFKDEVGTIEDIDKMIAIFEEHCEEKGTPMNKFWNSSSISQMYRNLARQESNWDSHLEGMNGLSISRRSSKVNPLIRDLEPYGHLLEESMKWHRRSLSYVHDIQYYKGHFDDERRENYEKFKETERWKDVDSEIKGSMKFLVRMFTLLDEKTLILFLKGD